MRSFLRYLIILAVILAMTWVWIPRWSEMAFPRDPGPKFDRRVRSIYTQKINEERPDIVLLGDSTLKDGVDPDLLAERTGRKVSKFDVPGSASAFWYLVLKNNVIKADHKPQMLVIIFRDTILTAPGYRVNGEYFTQLDEFAARQEPLLLERSYLNLMNPLEKLSETYFPLYGAREKIRDGIDTTIRYSAPGWLGCGRDCTDDSMYAVFTSADLEPGQLRNAVATAEQYLYTPTQLNFARQVDRSYLPEIIRLTKENGIQLILVRLKRNPAENIETSSVRRYIHDLSIYLDAHNVIFLDYGADPRLKSEHFKDGLHLNDGGRIVFTGILAEGLNKVPK